MPYCRKRGKKWYYTIEIGEGSARKKKEVPGGRTKAEAEKAYAVAMAKLQEEGFYTEPSKITVDEFFTEWLANDVAVNTHINTHKSYSSIYRNHIKPTLGGHQLRLIRPKTLQNLLNDKKAEGLAESTLGSLRTIFKRAFVYACDICEYIPRNPAQNIRVPNVIKEKKVVLTFTPQQIDFLFQKFPPGHQFFLPMAISYHTGARVSECLAFTWADCNLEDKELTVTKTVVVADHFPIIQPVPKSSCSNRTLPFSDTLARILKTEKAKQAAARLRYGKYYHNNDLICCREDGSLMGPDDMRYFNMVAKGMADGLSFHSLRHTHATMLLENGEDLELVSKRLGHSSVELTARTYSHVLEKRKAQTIKRLNEIL